MIWKMKILGFYNNIKNLEAKVINHLKLNNTALSLEEFVHF